MEGIICFFLGFCFALFIERIFPAGKNNTDGEEREASPASSCDLNTEKKLDPMTLRNGYGVTRCQNPTFAEQWVNIMNYSGENQKEEDYEGDYSAEDLG